MIIGGKEYQIGQHIRIISAKSILHYKYGMKDDENQKMSGETGIIVSESDFDEYAVANLKLDKEYAGSYNNGMTRLFKDDEIELVDEEDEAWKNAYGK